MRLRLKAFSNGKHQWVRPLLPFAKVTSTGVAIVHSFASWCQGLEKREQTGFVRTAGIQMQKQLQRPQIRSSNSQRLQRRSQLS